MIMQESLDSFKLLCIASFVDHLVILSDLELSRRGVEGSVLFVKENGFFDSAAFGRSAQNDT